MFLNEQIDIDRIERAAKKLSIVTHPIRAKIIELLLEKKEMSVTEIFLYLKILQSEASHHLNLLKDLGVVRRFRDGKKNIYSVKEEYFEKLIEVAKLLAATEK